MRAHLARCSRCTSEVESIRAAVAAQQSALTRLIAVQVDHDLLHARLKRTLASASSAGARGGDRLGWSRWSWPTHPVMITAVAATLAIVMVVALAGGPRAILIPLGLEAPPVAVARQPDLFMDYAIIQRLDALEHFDTVEAVPLDDNHHEAKRG